MASVSTLVFGRVIIRLKQIRSFVKYIMWGTHESVFCMQLIMQPFLHAALEGQVFLVLNVSLCILTESADFLFNKRQTES